MDDRSASRTGLPRRSYWCRWEERMRLMASVNSHATVTVKHLRLLNRQVMSGRSTRQTKEFRVANNPAMIQIPLDLFRHKVQRVVIPNDGKRGS